MYGLEKLLGDDAESRRLLAAARSVPGGLAASGSSRATPTDKSATGSGGLAARAAVAPGGQPTSYATEAKSTVIATHAEAVGTQVAAQIGRASDDRHLPRATSKIAELEVRVTESLESVTKEMREALDRGRKIEAVENDRAVAKGLRARVEAELNYWRMPSTGANAAGAGMTSASPNIPLRRLSEEELRGLQDELSAAAYKSSARALGASPLPGMVTALLEACERHHSVARGMGKMINDDKSTAEGRALICANALGHLLLEAERDCQSLALALAGGVGLDNEAGDVPELQWAQRLESTVRANTSGGINSTRGRAGGGATTGAVPPRLESLTDQLQVENEALRKEIARLRQLRDGGHEPVRKKHNRS